MAVTLWFEKRHRATAKSLCTAGGSLGTVIAPLVIAWMARFLPWHDVFIVAGLVDLVIAVAWALIYKNPRRSAGHRWPPPTRTKSCGTTANSSGPSRGASCGRRARWGVLLIRLISDPV